VGEHRVLMVGQRRLIAPFVLSLSKHYQVITCETRREALEQLSAVSPDLIVLDLASLRFDAGRFYQHVRRLNATVPFLLLLPRDQTFEYLPEARDYLYHPVDSRRLVRVVKRILPSCPSPPLSWGGLCLETSTHTLSWGDKTVLLRPKTAALLSFLLRNPERMLAQSLLIQQVWQTDFAEDTRVLQVQIYWARKALASLAAPFEIRAERGNGYGLFPKAETTSPEQAGPSGPEGD